VTPPSLHLVPQNYIKTAQCSNYFARYVSLILRSTTRLARTLLRTLLRRNSCAISALSSGCNARPSPGRNFLAAVSDRAALARSRKCSGSHTDPLGDRLTVAEYRHSLYDSFRAQEHTRGQKYRILGPGSRMLGPFCCGSGRAPKMGPPWFYPNPRPAQVRFCGLRKRFSLGARTPQDLKHGQRSGAVCPRTTAISVSMYHHLAMHSPTSLLIADAWKYLISRTVDSTDTLVAIKSCVLPRGRL
jgi:hypothetical protein